VTSVMLWCALHSLSCLIPDSWSLPDIYERAASVEPLALHPSLLLFGAAVKLLNATRGRAVTGKGGEDLGVQGLSPEVFAPALL